MALWAISGGAVHDPVQGIDGEIREVWIDGGRIVAAPTDPDIRPIKRLDASGCVVMAGGVDMHSHLAGPKVNAARRMRPEVAAVRGALPTIRDTGHLYAGLGFTTAFDAAIPTLMARAAHQELADLPILDTGFLTLAGNNHLVMEAIRDRRPDLLDAHLAWSLDAAKAYGVKIVNPGGIEKWKQDARGNVTRLDEEIGHFHVTPRRIVAELAASLDRLGVPHPLHVHCNNLGMPGNAAVTAETIDALAGARGHLAHVQFHSYGGRRDDEGSVRSAVPELVETLRRHPNVTVDVGHVLFGPTTSLTGDGPLGYYLHKVTGNKWHSADAEMETGCGVVPIEYREKSLFHAVQWAIGLEWYLLMDDPWRIALSTDHPNGGTFLRYPELLRLLMDRDHRRAMVERVHPLLAERSNLADLDREYTLQEIAVLTRAAPARLLGLENKGHLSPGADADVAVYKRDGDVARMFALPRYVVKAGEVVLDDGELRPVPPGRTHFVSPGYDAGLLPELRDWFERRYTVSMANYQVAERELARPLRRV